MQHEMDHLNGTMIIHKVGRELRRKAIQVAKKNS
jgi:peptide deformylase